MYWRPLPAAFLALALYIINPSYVHSQSSNLTITVTGTGETLEKARDDAVRQALQLAIKQLAVVDRVISGNKVLRDNVLSTMNGYIERYKPLDVRSTSAGFATDVEITVSGSRISNFLGISTGGGGQFPGSELQQEYDRRQAAASAAALQAQARGEIFDRLWRGFPSGAIEIATQTVNLSSADPNIIELGITYKFKDAYVSSLIDTLRILSIRKCVPWDRRQVPHDPLSHLATSDSYSSVCGNKTEFWYSGEKFPTMCVGFNTSVQCYHLTSGDYCKACRLYDSNLIIVGRFIDDSGASAMKGKECILSRLTSSQYNEPVRIEFTAESGPLFRGGVAVGGGYGTARVNVQNVDLSRAKNFVGVAVLGSGLVADLAPVEGDGKVASCTIVDDAVRHYLVAKTARAAPSRAKTNDRKKPHRK